jgi:hypothetical protein
VQKAAGTIATLYTGVLALAFSVSERPLPIRGLAAPVLLGLAIVLSTVYLAYLTPGRDVNLPKPHSNWRVATMRRLAFFVEWTRAGAMNRRYWLHASVIALAFAIALLPAPFVAIAGSSEDARDAAREARAWPPAPGGEAELAEILYAAQVSEAAALRDAAAELIEDGAEWPWRAASGGGAVLALLVPLATARDRPRG